MATRAKVLNMIKAINPNTQVILAEKPVVHPNLPIMNKVKQTEATTIPIKLIFLKFSIKVDA